MSFDTSDIIFISKPIKFEVTKEINGPWTAKTQFEVNNYVAAEQYIKEPFNNELYIVKKPHWIKSSGKKYIECDLWHNMAELSNETVERFYIKDTISNHLTRILSDSTDWTVGTCDISATILLKSDRRITVLEALNLLAEKAGGELDFNSADRTVDFKETIGTVTKLQIRYDKNCDYIEREEDSTNLITRLYPYGPDNATINTTIMQTCDDSTEWVGSGTSAVTDVTVKKMEGSGCISFTHSDGETCIADLGVGNELDLSGIDTIILWFFDNTGSGLDFDTNPVFFGIGEAAWDDNKITLTGTVNADSWAKVTVDISGIADADKNAIRYIGIEGGEEDFYFDDIRAVGQLYIDSANINDYKIPKEDVYFHSSEVEVTQKTVNIYPTHDAYVYQGHPNSNYGSSVQLKIRDYSSGDLISFIKWSLSVIPSNATITAATLKINIESTGFSSSEQTDVRNCDADWDGNTITWNNAPSDGADIGDLDVDSTGEQTLDVTTAVQDWFSGAQNNYGIRMQLNIPDVNKTAIITSNDAPSNRPYIQVTYTLADSSTVILEDAAQAYLSNYDEPKLKYKVRMVDLSKAIVDTWEDETINLGDTIRVYDKDLDINVDCRVKKITEDLLNPADTIIELTNRAYDITDSQAEAEKKFKNIMPFEDDKKIIYANTIQVGFIGGKIG